MAQDDIQGTVVDASGNPISGAIVELTRSYQSNPADKETVLRTTTDANGEYRFYYHPDGDGTTQEYHVSCYNYDGTAYVNSENNPGVTADLSASAIPDSGVEHRWPIQEGETTSATDTIGNEFLDANGATLVSSANYYDGYAWSLNGVDDTPSAPNRSTMSGYSAGTTQLLTLNPTSLDSDGDLVSVYNSTNDERAWSIRGLSGSSVDFVVQLSADGTSTNFESYDYSNTGVTLDTLNRVGFRWKSGSVPELIVNGSAQAPDSNTATLSNINQSTSKYRIGNAAGGVLFSASVIDIPTVVSEFWDDQTIQDDYDAQPWS